MSEWRDLAANDPHTMWPTFHNSKNRWPRYSPETRGVVYAEDDSASYSGLMGQSEYFSVYFVMRWNEGAGGQTIWRSFDGDDNFVSSRFRIDDEEVFFDWVGSSVSNTPDVLSADLWEGKGPTKLVAFKRVPFLNGTAHIISNGVNQVVSMANNGPLDEAQIVQIGNGFREGNTEYLQGAFHEIVMFDGALSSQEEAALVEYLDVKWGL